MNIRDSKVNEVQKFNQLYSNQKLIAGQKYFILSTKWLNEWKEYIYYDDIIAGRTPSGTFSYSLNSCINDDIIEQGFTATFKYYPLDSHPWNTHSKPLQLDNNCIAINKELWDYFDSMYQTKRIIRMAIQLKDGTTEMDLNLLKFRAILIHTDLVQNISCDMERSFDEKYLEASANATTEEYYKILEATVPTFHSQDYARKNNVRIWLYEGSDDELYSLISDQTKELSHNDDMIFELNGEFIPKDQQLLSEVLKLNSKTIVLIEFKDAKKGWCIKNENVPQERRCEYCLEWKELKDIIPCVCKKVFYCSQDCLKNNEVSHSYKCDKINSDDETMKNLEETDKSVLGVCGLNNLGNTCFMNSGVQCLVNTIPLIEYFLQNNHYQEINMNNPLGTKGELTKKFGNILKRIWYGCKSQISPLSLKAAIGKYQPMV